MKPFTNVRGPVAQQLAWMLENMPQHCRSQEEGGTSFEVEFYNKLVIMNGESPAGPGPIRQQELMGDLRDRQPRLTLGLLIPAPEGSEVGSAVGALHIEPPSQEEQESVISKEGTRNLLNHLDPFVAVDREVQNMIGIMMDDFVQRITQFGCTLAKHRRDNTVSAEDIHFAAQRLFGVSDDPAPENMNDLINPSKLQKNYPDEPPPY